MQGSTARPGGFPLRRRSGLPSVSRNVLTYVPSAAKQSEPLPLVTWSSSWGREKEDLLHSTTWLCFSGDFFEVLRFLNAFWGLFYFF